MTGLLFYTIYKKSFSLIQFIIFEKIVKIRIEEYIPLRQEKMTQIQYRNRSISQLVQQLNILGQTDVSIIPTHLLAIQSDDFPNLRRFKSKSNSQKQFFQCQKNDKKYNYQQISETIQNSTLLQQKGPFHQYLDIGYNLTIVLENQKDFVKKLLACLDKSKYLQNWNCFCAVIQNNSEILDLFGDCRISFRDLQNNSTFYRGGFTQKNWQTNQKKLQDKLVSLSFTKSQSLKSSPILTIILLPPTIFQQTPQSPWSIVKSQLYQVLNYIRTNPQKRYENISKLITKRHPFTSYFANIFMQDSINIVINQINQKSLIGRMEFYDKLGVVSNLIKKAYKKQQFKFLQKPAIQKQQTKIGKKTKNNFTSKQKVQHQKSRLKDFAASPIRHQQNISSNSVQNFSEIQKQTLRNKAYSSFAQSKLTNFVRTELSPIYAIKSRVYGDINRQNQLFQNQLHAKELDYCRSLQRKTHKFSISPALNTQQSQLQGLYSPKGLNKKLEGENQFLNAGLNAQSQNNNNFNFFKETRQKSSLQNAKIEQHNNHKEAIAILKAQHACQISQYHQTIQNLNKKILILTKEKGLQQLYSIHERQIMLLQLKIQQLRGDIKQITKDQVNDKSMKFMVRKLNEQIQRLQQNTTKKKITQSKMFMLQKQIKDFKTKYDLSQKARKNLSCQVDALTKRLKIRDAEVRQIHQHELQRYNSDDLSLTEDQVLADVKKLISGIQKGERNCSQFLIRKVTNILGDLSKTRDIILECNDFLVELQQLLQNQLSTKEPQIVLDCNKFIRQFLINNLAIF